MDRGTYVAASGGLAQFRKLEVVNNNLANINTVGFKREVLKGEAQSFDQTLASLISNGNPYAKGDNDRAQAVVNVGTFTDFAQGPIQSTGNPLDVALRKTDEFFAINTPQGIQYTRAGNFTLNSEGTLVTQDGFEAQGDGGAIQLNGPNARIQNDGSVLAGGSVQGALAVFKFADASKLVREGGNRFSAPAGAGAPEQVTANLATASLEMSNVSAITSVTDLMSAQRAFQMYTKAAESIDSINQVSINQIGRRT